MKSKSLIRCIVLGLALMLFATAPAYAGISVSATPDYPETVTVGDTNVRVALEIRNTNFGGEKEHSNLIRSIFHIPSCGSALIPGACISPSIDPGVFSVNSPGIGREGTACAGIVFTITVYDALTGEVSMEPASPITLTHPGTGATEACVIDFTVNVLTIPTKDASLTDPGLQTAQHGRVLVSSVQNPGLTGGGSGTDITTVFGCGDGIVGNSPGETCDPPGSTPNTPPGNTNQCRASCTYCGDGTINNGEQCDDGNNVNGDGCNNTCQTEVCDVLVDKQVSCDGGITWVDTGLVTDNEDTTNGCTATGSQPMMVRYQARNAGAQNVFNCSIGESNTLFGTGVTVGDLTAGTTSSLLPATLTPLCSAAAGNEPNTATLTCQCGAPGSQITDTAVDRATFTCRKLPSVAITKSCNDEEQVCTDTAIIFTIGVKNTGLNTLSSCIVTDDDCTVIGTPDLTNILPGQTRSYTCSKPADPGGPAINNSADVSCTDEFGQTATGSVTSNACSIPPCQVETCRTPGFWATHAGTEKSGSWNITEMVIKMARGQFIMICGEMIDDTYVNSADSAVEAMCVPVKADSRLQLVRQLTAAALNCLVSGGGADCTDISIEDVFKECNADCAANAFDPYSVTDCINRIDCFNNGGEWDVVNNKCWLGICQKNTDIYCNTSAECPGNTVELTNPCIPIPGNCHDRDLGVCKVDGRDTICTEETGCDPGSICDPGSAGSSKACNDANRTKCTVIQPGEAQCKSGAIEK